MPLKTSTSLCYATPVGNRSFDVNLEIVTNTDKRVLVVMGLVIYLLPLLLKHVCN